MKKVKILLIALILIIGGLIATRSYALDYDYPIHAQLDRPFHGKEYKYEVPASPASVKYTAVKIFDGSDATKSYPYYCLRGGVGFGQIDSSLNTTTANYADVGEMHYDADAVIADYLSLYGVDLNRTETMALKSGTTKNVNIYNAILWILDEAYIPLDIDIEESGEHFTYSQAEYKEKLLAKAGIRTQSDRDSLNEDDIEVIQQLAVWYFTNYDEQKAGTKPTVSQASKYVAQHMYIDNNNNIDNQKARNMDKLYQYLVYGAIENCDSYEIDPVTKERVKEIEYNEFDRDNSQLEMIDHNVPAISPRIPYGHSYEYYYMIGPIVIAGDSSKTVDSTNIVLYDNDGNPISKFYEQKNPTTGESTGRDTIYEFYEDNSSNISTDSQGKVITTASATASTTLKKGTGYYIKFYKIYETEFNHWAMNNEPELYADFDFIPNGVNNSDHIDSTYDLSKINIRLSSVFTESVVEYLEGGNANQAVAQIIKVKLTDEDWLEIEPPPAEKFYDLSLRKFITMKNGEAVSSRVPTINTNTLINGRMNERGELEYTATYNHSKTPIDVKRGDRIVYTIRVYNEGDIDGKALEVKDYLPAGLDFVPATQSSINRQYGWTVNGRVLTTDYLKDTTIKAFDPGKTTFEAGWQRATTGAGGLYYADLLVECEVVANPGATEQTLRNIAEISQDDGDDRDSTPGNVNTNSYNPPSDNSTYQNDDDDYEPLKLGKGRFDLALRKFIIKAGETEYNNENNNSREPEVDTSTLVYGQPNQNGELEYTATYTHPKNKVEIQTGDRVIYVIRVYNEGDIAGKATKVRDYLPAGLSFVEDSTINTTYGWTANGRVVETSYLSNVEIPAFERGDNDNDDVIHYADLKIECEVTATVGSLDQTLRNIAEITQDNGDDEDSTPNNVDINNYTPEEYEEFLSTYQEDDDDFEDLVLKAKKFDLALRKYITGVERNGQNITIENARDLNNIDTSNLDAVLNNTNEYATAEYKHRKDPVNVEPGDIVTYTFRVYNESETDGQVNAIIDYLPEGLDLDTEGLTAVESTDSNIEKWYKYDGHDGMIGDTHNIYTYYEFNKTTRRLTITRLHRHVGSAVDSHSYDENYIFRLNGYKKYNVGDTSELSFEGTGYVENLNYGELPVRLKLTASYAGEDQILTNIATMRYSAINANLNDGDSSQDVSPDETAEDLTTTDIGYTGNDDNKEDLTDSDYYYEGQQDDDDFEKVIIKAKEFDLALRKFISKVERVNRDTHELENLEITSREPSIEITDLKEGNSDTARYVHPKTKLSLKRGDIVTYTIRIYNEGDINGYATEVKDYLPEGLELVEGRNQIWTADGNTITTTLTNQILLPKYDKNMTEAPIMTQEYPQSLLRWQKASDDDTGLYYVDLDVVCKIKDNVTDGASLVNIAEVFADLSTPTDIDDRDSEPANFPDSDKNNDYNGNGEEDGYYPGKQDDDDFEPITIEPDEVFDLALRKYITKVNGEEVASRNPDIDKEDLNNGSTTAEYKHRKDPVEVKTGDTVTYKITVYNEGEAAGRATKIVDQLPTGIRFVRVVSGNYDLDNYNEDTNKVSFKEKSTNTDLAPYNKETKALASTTIEIECEVVETVGKEDKVLTNIAWISEEYNAFKDLTITNQNGADRDSEPATAPDKNKDELKTTDIGYTGKDSHPETELPENIYFEGKQDDDDFEKVVIKGKNFDLALRKYITKVNGQDVPSRVPDIDKDPLNNGTTADYKHRKDPVAVEPGDIVTYKITIYNEGEISGRATKIADQLPSGVRFVGVVSGNFELDNYDEGANKVSLKEKFANANLAPYNKDTQALDSTTIEIECEVTEDVSSKDKVLTNVAWISEEYNAETNTIITSQNGEDKDSEPASAPHETQDGLKTIEEIGYTGKDTHQETELPENKYFEGYQDDDDFEKLVLKGKYFDLALRKYITNVERDGQNITIANERDLNNIDTSRLNNGSTTADYYHRKDAVEVEPGDIVTYRLATYNEGQIAGFVISITDFLPKYLDFVPTDGFVSEDEVNQYDQFREKSELTAEEQVIKNKVEAAKYIYKYDEENRPDGKRFITIKKANYTTVPITGNVDALWLLQPYDGRTLDSKYVEVKFKVNENAVSQEDKYLTNIATMEYAAERHALPDNSIQDRDSDGMTISIPDQDVLVSENETSYKGNDDNKSDLTDTRYHYKGQEDDDDFEKLVVKAKNFDLSLRKYIASIKRGGKDLEFDSREPGIDTNSLINGTFNRNGTLEYTATYEHPKDPLVVKKGDIVTYTIRIYNEGEIDGYAAEVTDYIPEGLALIQNYKTNYNNGWKLDDSIDNSHIINLIGEDGFYKDEESAINFDVNDFEDITSLKEVQLVTGKVAIKTTELDDELIKAFDQDKTSEEDGWQKAQKGEGGLYYKDIQVTCLVIAENSYKDIITNNAEISLDKDGNGNDVEDRDSTPGNITDRDEDDNDYEPIILRNFDLALRKFITNIDSLGKSTEVTSRIPEVKIGEDGNITYEHSKDPIYVANNDLVTYTIRVYNEGTTDGYAEEVADDLPEGLLFLPDNNTNKEYGWVMLDKDGNVTDDVEKAVRVTTDYLSSAKERTEGRDNLLKAFDSSKEISTEEPYNPDYRDVKLVFQIIEPNTSDRVLVNSAQITEDSGDDDDSIPGEWNEGEDDQDREYVSVRYFDLSLLKWVTQSIVTVDGKTTTTETGFMPNTGLTDTTGIRDNSTAEPIAKVELDRKKLDKTTVKFVYKIRVTNEGNLPGYATEVTDFIPDGLEFVEEDNQGYGWTKQGDTKVTTRALETTLLNPGESAELTIVFRWIKGSDNLGLKTNIAEITEDYNEYDSSDIDSTPNDIERPYEKEQEDDDDFALVILSLKTGKEAEYTLFIISMVALLTTGIYLVKRYVLD